MGQIRVNYEELYDLARALKQNGDDLFDLASKIKNNVTAKTAGWEGESKQRYIDDFDALYPTLSQKLPELLKRMATVAKKKADAFREADEN